MRIGTRSLAYGAHCVPIHAFFVLLAWAKLYGFPRDYRLYIAALTHDIGYLRCTTMDGRDGELHPALGGVIMGRLFGKRWAQFTAGHSRFFARIAGHSVSRLCAADKLAVALEPWWLYLPRVIASGEIKEYMREGPRLYPDAYPGGRINGRRAWFENMVRSNRAWVRDHAHTGELSGMPDDSE